LWTRALAEAFLAFFCLLAFWLVTCVVRTPVASRRRFLAAAGLGAAVGLATATKLSGSLLGAGLFLYVLLRQGVRWSRDRSFAGFGPWIDAGMAAVLVFVLVNPLLYPNPVLRTAQIFEHRRDEMEQQALGTPRLAIPDDLGIRASVMFERTFRDWGLFEQRTGLPIDGPLAAVGLVLVIVATWRSARRRDPPGSEALVLCWAVAVYGVSTVTLGFDSSHYFAPPATVAVLLQAVALVWMARAGPRFIQGRRQTAAAGSSGASVPRTAA
jgi:4-amino-4-deoxy-L-arabinose transferase-like glycosyltransferase